MYIIPLYRSLNKKILIKKEFQLIKTENVKNQNLQSMTITTDVSMSIRSYTFHCVNIRYMNMQFCLQNCNIWKGMEASPNSRKKRWRMSNMCVSTAFPVDTISVGFCPRHLLISHFLFSISHYSPHTLFYPFLFPRTQSHFRGWQYLSAHPRGLLLTAEKGTAGISQTPAIRESTQNHVHPLAHACPLKCLQQLAFPLRYDTKGRQLKRRKGLFWLMVSELGCCLLLLF